MTSGASWNERGLSPELYEAAQEAARRAGMSVEEWLNSTFGAAPSTSARPRNGRAEPPSPSLRGARLSDTVAKLNARLEQLTSGRMPESTPAEPARRDRSPPLAPEAAEPGLDQVIAEI